MAIICWIVCLPLTVVVLIGCGGWSAAPDDQMAVIHNLNDHRHDSIRTERGGNGVAADLARKKALVVLTHQLRYQIFSVPISLRSILYKVRVRDWGERDDIGLIA